MANISGYWTGSFDGTNRGGVGFSINQHGAVLGGVATMFEPELGGPYQYVISGNAGDAVKMLLQPASGPKDLLFGTIVANAHLSSDGQLCGLWESSIGTKGSFMARRYEPTHGKETRKNVFISYSHKDADFLDELRVHLRPLEKEGLIDCWADTRIKAGNLWKVEIEAALKRVNVAVLLISPHFLASDFIIDKELPTILSKAKDEGVVILPVILRPCRFTRDLNLGIFQALNDPLKPLAAMQTWERDAVYDSLSARIESESKV